VVRKRMSELAPKIVSYCFFHKYLGKLVFRLKMTQFPFIGRFLIYLKKRHQLSLQIGSWQTWIWKQTGYWKYHRTGLCTVKEYINVIKQSRHALSAAVDKETYHIMQQDFLSGMLTFMLRTCLTACKTARSLLRAWINCACIRAFL